MKNINKPSVENALKGVDPEKVAKLTNEVGDLLFNALKSGEYSPMEVAFSMVSFIAMSAKTSDEIDALAKHSKDMLTQKKRMEGVCPVHNWTSTLN